LALAEIAFQVELAGKAKDLIKAGPLISEIDHQLKTFKKSLTASL